MTAWIRNNLSNLAKGAIGWGIFELTTGTGATVVGGVEDNPTLLVGGVGLATLGCVTIAAGTALHCIGKYTYRPSESSEEEGIALRSMRPATDEENSSSLEGRVVRVQKKL